MSPHQVSHDHHMGLCFNHHMGRVEYDTGSVIQKNMKWGHLKAKIGNF